jgi:hypothetical protein
LYFDRYSVPYTTLHPTVCMDYLRKIRESEDFFRNKAVEWSGTELSLGLKTHICDVNADVPPQNSRKFETLA